MCGRYVNVADDADLVAEFDAEVVLDDPPGRSWNIAPTDPVRMIVRRTPKDAASDAPAVRQLRTARWGLVPSWSRDAKGGARMINARIETVTEKPAFKAAAGRRRCLVPALGYYEWQRTEHGKLAHFLHDPDGRLLAFAGLYELWRDRGRADDDPDRWLVTCTIITEQASDLLGEIHDRNPVVVPPDLWPAWLDCSAGDPALARRLLDAMPEARLEPRVVSDAVGNVRNNGPQLIEPVRGPADQPLPLDL
jgi:putative SOS response-associated peptidase YedK